MSEIRPRIVGTEMEWPITERLLETGEEQQFVKGAGLISKYRDPEIKSSGHSSMLSNGGRYYLDVGDHVEYASPEDTSFEGALANELAGEQIVIDGLIRYIKDNEKIEQFRLRKRVVDDKGTTWGYHVNLSADRKKIPSINDKYMHLLGLHLATSLPMLGSGTIYGSPGEERYSLGQKVLGLHHDYCVLTTRTNKGLINQRDEPLAPEEGLHRVHLTSTDPHISPWATRVALGSYSLILRAIEQGRADELRLARGGLENPLLCLSRMNATDLTFKKTATLEDGRTITPNDIQQEIIGIVSKTDHTDEEAAILEQWRHAVDDLAIDPMRLVDRSDAIAKLNFIQKRAERYGEDIDVMSTKRAQTLELFYDTLADINGDELRQEELRGDKDKRSVKRIVKDIYEQSLPHKLRTRHMAGMMVADDMVAKAVYDPPTTTRAYERGNAIKKGDVLHATWIGYTRRDQENKKTHDPYSGGAV